MKNSFKIWFCYLLLYSFASEGQITMSLQVPPYGVLLKSQLWNMVLVNTGNTDLTVQVNLVLVDQQSNQTVLTATSSPVLLSKGARQIQEKDLSPITYEYSGSSFSSSNISTGLLPTGSYQACYSVQGLQKASFSENCILLNIDPLSPPLLNQPVDEGEIYNFYPQFSWLPPSPLAMFSNLNYEFLVVEIHPGQSKLEAIEQNVPFYSASRLKNSFVNYPSSYPAFDTAKTYAWKVIALNNSQAVSMTDVWTFRIKRNALSVRKKQETPYIVLQRGSTVSVASVNETMRLVYDNPAGDTTISFQIRDLEDPSNRVIQNGIIKIKRGSNLIEIPCNSSQGYSKKNVYEFSFSNRRNELWKVKFTWSPSDNEN